MAEDTDNIIKQYPPSGIDLGQGSTIRNAAILFAGLSVVFLISLVYHAPAGDYFTICTFKNLTGLPCPGCGLTHSFCSFAKGHIEEALTYNGIGPVLFIVMIFVWLRNGLVLLGRSEPASQLDAIWRKLHLTATFGAAFFVYGIGRMVYILIYSPDSIHRHSLHQLLGLH
ncbi:MAG TPA: DUF2752 domain-containing protein [Blastocatellia bacterium]|nr:DUF2752 domain-containing protein [Blastocatellia bacterium]